MANIIIGFPNRVDADATFASVAFSNGSWLSSMPLVNLRDPQLAKVARSTDATTTSTKFDTDLGVLRNIKLAAIPFFNLSRVGLYRITASTVSDFASLEFDSGWKDAWETVYPFGSLPFHNPSWWDGKLSPEEAVNYKQPIVEVLETDVIARYWRVEFDDTANAQGYIQIPRLFLTSGYQPTINVGYGSNIGWATSTVARESLGGARFFDRRPTRRVLRVLFKKQDIDEMLVWNFDMQSILNLNQQVFIVFNSEDTSNLTRLSFLATIRRLTSLEWEVFERGSIAMEFEEVL